ncbi:MAG: hypothetical protein ABSG61_03580 [Gemmatimonadales bacterium]|jgi:hypothetical protein
MSTLRVALILLGALLVPACKSRGPQAPAARPTAPAAAETSAPAVEAQHAPRALHAVAAPMDTARGRAGAKGFLDTLGYAGSQPSAAGLLLVSDRTMSRSRATLAAGRVRIAAAASVGRTRGSGPSLGARPATEADSVPQDVPVAGQVGARAFRPVAILVLADHRVDPGTGVEHTSSLMYGAGFEATTRGWLSVRGEITAGTLTSRQTGVRDRSVTDARLDLGVAAFPWLTLLAGGGLRVYKQDAQENWRFLRFGAEARFPLGVDALTGMVRFTVSPMVSRATGATSALSPSFAMAGASGLQLTYRLLYVGVEYAVESYTFPSSGGITRLEEFSGLKLRLGLNLGW